MPQLLLQLHQGQVGLGRKPVMNLTPNFGRDPAGPALAPNHPFRLAAALTRRRHLPSPASAYAKPQRQFPQRSLASVISLQILPPQIIIVGSRHLSRVAGVSPLILYTVSENALPQTEVSPKSFTCDTETFRPHSGLTLPRLKERDQ